MSNTQEKAKEITEMERRIEKALDKIRPALQMDGGDVELVEMVGKSAKVRLMGMCAGCPSAQMTLLYGVERALREEVPELDQVIPVR